MRRRRGPNVSWFVLLAIFLPLFVVAALLAFYPTGWVTVLIVGLSALYMVALPVVSIVVIVRRDHR